MDIRLEPFVKEKYETLEYHISNLSKPAASRILELIKNRKHPEKKRKIFNPPRFPAWSEFWDRSKVTVVLEGKLYVETPSAHKKTELEVSSGKLKKYDDFWQAKAEEVRGSSHMSPANRKHIENVKRKLRSIKNLERGGSTKFCIVQ